MVAALKLREITTEATGQDLALKYQLVSRWTNYLAVVVRADGKTAETLPDLHKVEQMLAAGWGGTGTIRYSRSTASMDLCMSIDTRDIPTFLRKSESGSTMRTQEPMILYQSAPSPPSPQQSWLWGDEHHDAMTQFIELLDITLVAGTVPATIHLPLLPAEIELLLGQLVTEGYDERVVVTVFLHHLAGTTAGDKLSRQAKRVISKVYKELNVDQQVASDIKFRLRKELGEAPVVEDEFDTPTFLRKGKGIGAIP